MRLLRWIILLQAFVISPSVFSGPPLSTEDPGVLSQDEWEIIVASTATGTESGDLYRWPILDISYGLIGDQVQISAAYPYVFSDLDDQDSDSDFGNLELGIKWLLWDSADLQAAIAPVYSFGIPRSLAERGIGDDSDVLQLPVTLEYRINERLRFNPAAGYARVQKEDNQWVYGAAMAYQLNDRWELLWELAGASDTSFDEDALDVRAGFDFAIRQDFHLLFSMATGLREPVASDELNYDVYLGLQWFR